MCHFQEGDIQTLLCETVQTFVLNQAKLLMVTRKCFLARRRKGDAGGSSSKLRYADDAAPRWRRRNVPLGLGYFGYRGYLRLSVQFFGSSCMHDGLPGCPSRNQVTAVTQ